MLRYGMVEGDLQTACKVEPRIVSSSHYVTHIQNWQKAFPDTPIHFVYQEHLDKDQDGFVRGLCNVINVPYMPVPIDLQNKYNTTTSGISFIAGFTQKTADFLRERQIYAPINMAKSIGLKHIIFGKDQQRNDGIPIADKQFLIDHLQSEADQFEAEFGKVKWWHE